jgi:hypothetical protein
MGRFAMSGAQDNELAEAVRAERENGDKHFVTIRNSCRHIVGLKAALEEEAARSGRMLVMEMRRPERLAERRSAAPVTVDRNDARAFLRNLKGIAAGEVDVV